MKVFFLVDNISAIQMFVPIIQILPDDCEVLLLNYDGWTNRNKTEIEGYLQQLELRHWTIGKRDKHSIEEILKRKKPNVIVLARDGTTHLEQLFIELAKSKNIPTLLVPHGIWTPDQRRNWGRAGMLPWLKHLRHLGFQGYNVIRAGDFSWIRLFRTGLFRIRHELKWRPILAGHGGCSRIAAYGDAMKELLVSEGIDARRIKVTGNPKFDSLYNAKKSNRETQIDGELETESQKTVLLLTDYLVEFGMWSTKQRERFVMSIYEAVKRVPECRLIIKIHPVNENEDDYIDIIKNISPPPLIYRDYPLAELINTCSVAITTRSTAGLEAMAMDKPLLVVNYYNDLTPYDDKCGAILVNNEADLYIALENVVRNGLDKKKEEAAGKYVYRQAYIQDGKAAARITALINEMSSEAKVPH